MSSNCVDVGPGARLPRIEIPDFKVLNLSEPRFLTKVLTPLSLGFLIREMGRVTVPWFSWD